MRRVGGLTLVEILVALAVGGLALLLASQLLAPATRIWRINQARSAVEQTSIVLETRLVREILPSTADSVTTLASPPALSFLTPGGYDERTGRPIWSGFVIYCLDRDNRILYRKLWPNPDLPVQEPPLPYTFPTEEAVQLTPEELERVCTTCNGTERPVAYSITGFTAELESAQGLLTLAARYASETSLGLELRSRSLQLHMRN
ncbi:MAG TPA: prepilin-type N-terminal cleavage/methylation domain-containing protein [Candidatus Nitrosotenuis sp.]|jgi:hypothetical protein|nr:prepilin-type N-terminal cleavage/methylation domain-containing protein [Candidatus Nitrosotenuis sp.]